MKLKLIITCFLCSIAFGFAQNSGTIKGKVIDKKTNEPLPYVNIILKDNDKIVTGGVTTEDGNFAINKLAIQKYTVEIQFIGYTTVVKNIDLTADANQNLGTIAILEDISELKDVEVVAERSNMVQKIDRKVINVGKDLIASGTTASEIMNNIPTVSIDPQTKEISMRGNSNVRVLIDGKPSNVSVEQLLQQIPSASIKQIELITNPSAKYNPEGMSGIINIILHKNSQDGFNGSLNTGVTFGITPKTNSALNMNYRVGKVNFYTNYGFNHGINANNGYVESERTNEENRQDFNFRNKNNSHLLKLGMDYYINEKNTISAYTNQSFTYGSGTGLTTIIYDDPVANDNIIQYFDSKGDNKNQTYDLVYKHDFDKKDENLELQLNYSHTENNENTLYEETSSLDRTNIVPGTTDYFQFNADYVNPITETTKLELGVETRIQNSGNRFYDDNPSAISANNSFEFGRNIYSAYANLGKQIGKWSGQLGVRLEYFDLDADFAINETNPSFTDAQNISDDLFTAYPSAFLTYTANDKNSFNFNYSRRVDRPSIGQISPIREWTTPLMESRGNPALVPQFTNSFEINYTRTTKIGSITSGVFYRSISDEISRVVFNDPNNPNRNILSYDNFDNNDAFGIETSGNLKFAKWWAVNASSDVYFKTAKGTVQNANTNTIENKEVDVVTFNVRMNNTFTVTKDLRFQLFGMYRGKDRGLQYDRLEMYKMDFGATYNILKGKGTITARYNDVFENMRFAFDGNIPFRQQGAFYWESQTFYVGFNYIFGGGKNRALARKQRDANEVQSGGGMF
ncbi:outer membrane receptor for ferrienterochelin and colicin [Flavobacterium aquaticum]|uniref:Outer membrane receptor for ferrienterochelin and colicin n=1 Tax=Flavobacterium aquaticum TaxID=1236486 RepID=A0A327YQM2_9FLAO|nr:outer membrane beta-barrel family protein [Flavobacterium aquaticum]RAK22616.1 outer membrane receptor for ferrienterochelin and colicin [Flavobacterium aquaticum]